VIATADAMIKAANLCTAFFLTGTGGSNLQRTIGRKAPLPRALGGPAHALSFPKSRFESIDDISRQGSEAQQRLRPPITSASLASPAPPAKKVNHETAAERFS
jgi:predicted secreted Zn-dependent protease